MRSKQRTCQIGNAPSRQRDIVPTPLGAGTGIAPARGHLTGAEPPTNDIWVAARAARSGSTVLTFDEHFRSIERVGTLVLG